MRSTDTKPHHVGEFAPHPHSSLILCIGLRRKVPRNMASHPDTKLDCSKVYVKKSSWSNEETGQFDGAFAAVDIKEGMFENGTVKNKGGGPQSVTILLIILVKSLIGELVEKGLMRRLPDGFDGHKVSVGGSVSCFSIILAHLSSSAHTFSLGVPKDPTKLGQWDLDAQPTITLIAKARQTHGWSATTTRIALRFLLPAILQRARNLPTPTSRLNGVNASKISMKLCTKKPRC